MTTQLWKCKLLREKSPSPSFVDGYYNIGYSLDYFVHNAKIIISQETAFVKNDPNCLWGMVPWTFISWKNLPLGANDVVYSSVRVFPSPKTDQNQGTSKFSKSLSSLLLNFHCSLLSAVPVPGSSDRGCIKRHLTCCHCLQEQCREGETFTAFPDKFSLKPRGVFAGRARCVSRCCCRLERKGLVVSSFRSE